MLRAPVSVRVVLVGMILGRRALPVLDPAAALLVLSSILLVLRLMDGDGRRPLRRRE